MALQFKIENNLEHLSSNRHIPADILEEILLKLPAKSLNLFHIVSKSWQSLISSHKFIIKNHMIAESKFFQRTLIHNYHLNTLPFYVPDSPNLLHRNVNPGIFGQTNIFGPPASCHGLICVKNSDDVLSVWNPSTRMIKHIPNSSGTCFGIGHDAARDDYKIVKLSEKTKTEIYSLKTGSWTIADDFPIIHICLLRFDRCESVYLDGAIHWLATYEKSIFSFDLSTNKYRRIPLPEYKLMKIMKHGYSQQIRLAALRGMLYVLINDTSGLMLWGLKEDYKDQSSWIRFVQIPWSVLSECFIPYFKLIYVYENGEFLIGAVKRIEMTEKIRLKTEMIICKESRIILRQITPHHPNVIPYGVVQVESVVSLGSDAKIHPLQ